MDSFRGGRDTEQSRARGDGVQQKSGGDSSSRRDADAARAQSQELRDAVGAGAEAQQAGEDANQQPFAEDLPLEQIAHRFAYQDETDEAEVAELGYSSRFIEGVEGFQGRVFTPLEGRDVAPVFAFRGTDEKALWGSGGADVRADADQNGVGFAQFLANEGAIVSALTELSALGPTTVTGHSLGGALAQIAACLHPGLVARCVTFQAPGVERELVERLAQHNRDNPEEAVESRHHVVQGDVVHRAGEAHTPGEQVVHDLDGIGPFGKHTNEPLAQYQTNPEESSFEISDTEVSSPSYEETRQTTGGLYGDYQSRSRAFRSIRADIEAHWRAMPFEVAMATTQAEWAERLEDNENAQQAFERYAVQMRQRRSAYVHQMTGRARQLVAQGLSIDDAMGALAAESTYILSPGDLTSIRAALSG